MARRILSAKIKIQLVPYQTANKIKHPPLNIRSVIFWKDNVTYNKKRGNRDDNNFDAVHVVIVEINVK